ncbi:hypothetical protein PVNG_02424 [Plasmodium vivax North Korean]|uniref:DNA 3'-5' helicase n=1 Tax=Plasmodium vivax North Korean TaxID=1035514 RepID=A0A0J9TM94_PLAVI|nr:hypothetical protein PVNG_02424 [Plasmodium vivax North Korean]
MTLNEQQSQAAYADLDQHILIIAGAGTGKTRTLVERYRYLLKNGISKREILVTTYTKKAKKEVEERISEDIEIKERRYLEIYTNHQFCRNIIASYEDFEELPDIVEENLVRKFSKEEYPNLDIIKTACYVLEKNNHLQENHLKIYKYLLFDEYQDIDPYTYQILTKFLNLGGKIVVVGDPNQSIYEFRGTVPKPFEDFAKDFSHFLIKMNLNYRSTPDIIKFANKLISHNHQGQFKNFLIPFSTSEEKVEMVFAKSKTEMDEFLVEKLKEIQREKPQDTIAILFRTNQTSKDLKRLLEKKEIYVNDIEIEDLKDRIMEINLPEHLKELFFSLFSICMRSEIIKESVRECLEILDKSEILQGYRIKQPKDINF